MRRETSLSYTLKILSNSRSKGQLIRDKGRANTRDLQDKEVISLDVLVYKVSSSGLTRKKGQSPYKQHLRMKDEFP